MSIAIKGFVVEYIQENGCIRHLIVCADSMGAVCRMIDELSDDFQNNIADILKIERRKETDIIVETEDIDMEE